MNTQRHVAWSLVILAVCCLAGERAVQAQDSEKRDTGGIDPKVVEAWEKAGASFGWLSQENSGSPQFNANRPQDMLAIPAFRPGPAGVAKLKDLPAPAVPFGLDLSDAAPQE